MQTCSGASTTVRITPRAIAVLSLLVSLAPGRSVAAERCPDPAGQIISVEGTVTVDGALTAIDAFVCPGDSIETAALSRAAIWFREAETIVRLDQLSSLEVPEADGELSVLELLRGALYFFSRTPRKIEIKAPFVNATIEGTEFVLRAGPEGTELALYEGRVIAKNDAGETRVAPSSIVTVESGEAAPAIREFGDATSLQAALVEAVDWVLYYPPLFDADALARLTPAVRQASRALRAGQIDEALALLPPDATDRDGNALAIRAIASLVRGRTAAAEQYVERALVADPGGVPPLLAQSYTRQASFDLPGAIAAAETARESEPGNPLALARLAELQLATGRLDEALRLAEAAADQAPDLPQVQTVLGFANLTRIRVDDAEAAFQQAIELDSSMPLPRLGLGLVSFRKGERAEGRAKLEQVVALDPLRSLYRSYLGKAYYEEKREDSLAESQFALAKDLDPLDPTPWLYSAIMELTRNRPVVALHDLQGSIQRNDNRAVFRSKLLLDEDLATRSASLARIYDELGFEQTAVLESSRSLDLDPGNFSAHRFLADAFARRPGFEIASVSERLQGQLFQPLNVLPVQPQITVTDLALTSASGPAAASLNEYTPLLQSDGPHLLVSLLGGNQDTWGDELILSGVHRELAYSLGQFHAESDGFRDNNDAKYDIFNAFGQIAASPQLNLQLELRHRKSDQGDLRLQFDLDDFDPEYQRSIDQDTIRVGARISPQPNSDLILSAFYSDREESGQERQANADLDIDSKENGYQAEARYLYRSDDWNLTLGLGRYDVENKTRFVVTPDLIVFPPIPRPPFLPPGPPIVPPPRQPPPRETTSNFDVTQNNAYAYANLMPADTVELTLGLSYDDFSGGPVDTDRFNPKFGLRWEATRWMQLRLAAFQTVKRALVVNQTIEPTQVAGFNQFFDDFNGTRTTRYGLGLDFRPSTDVLAGIEYSKRDMKVPVLSLQADDASIDKQDIKRLSAYGYWTFHDRWALRGDLIYEDFDGDSNPAISGPSRLKTTLAPLGLNYHHPNGFFAGVEGLYIHQKIRPDPGTTGSASDDGVIVNLGLGYRLPKRRGIVRFRVENLFDKQISFQDNSFRTPTENVRAPYSPERAIRLELSLNF